MHSFLRNRKSYFKNVSLLPEFLAASAMYSFEQNNGCLLANWNGGIRMDSEEFTQSLTALLPLLVEKEITCLLLSADIPLEGALNLESLDLLEKFSPDMKLQKIALLESQNFLWDNNVLQTFALIKELAGLPTLIEAHPTKQNALAWFKA